MRSCKRLIAYSLLLLTTVNSSRAAEPFLREGTPSIPKTEVVNASITLPHFEDLARELSNSVVNVSADSNKPKPEADQAVPGLPFFRGNPDSPSHSLGSGFIVSEDGYIVTNYHVIEDADKIIVRLLDDKAEYTAKLIGRDEKTDLALIKIEARKKLEAIYIGDSDALKVGEWVLAIGNQFQLGQTVTAGIVSAKSRRMPTKASGPYDDFIQTDASINPGSSGGPLFNTKGQVIGINTAIFSPGRSQFGGSGFNIGIGFAIPMNLARGIIQQLRERGKVTRGLLGVIIQHIDNDVATALDLSNPDGALVSDVVKGSPAEKGQFKIGDIITSFDGQPIRDHDDLPLMVANTKIGSTVPIEVIRDGAKVTLHATISELSVDATKLEIAADELKANEIGLIVDNLDQELAKSLKLDSTTGVVVHDVTPGSPAHEAGLMRGDIIVQMGGQPIEKLDNLNAAIKKLRAGKPVLVLVRRKEGTRFLTLKKD